MKFSATLLSHLYHVRQQFPAPDLTRRSAVLKNLVFLFHTMRASEQLLELAIETSEEGTPLRDYFARHLEEERGHHRWLAADLLSAGVDVTQTGIPLKAVEMVGTQYYLVRHLDPAALLGYMAHSECLPTPPGVVDELEAAHGKELLRTLRYHAEHDADHGRELLQVVDGLPGERQLIVLESALQSARYFGLATQAFD